MSEVQSAVMKSPIDAEIAHLLKWAESIRDGHDCGISFRSNYGWGKLAELAVTVFGESFQLGLKWVSYWNGDYNGWILYAGVDFKSETDKTDFQQYRRTFNRLMKKKSNGTIPPIPPFKG